MSKDYERINFNIKSDLLETVDKYCSAGYGRSALLNYLVARSLDDPITLDLLETLYSKRSPE